MEIIKAYAVNNLCYITAQKMIPAGIVVHSTGVNNPYLKRYVDCPKEVGENAYGNHWNNATPDGRKVCVHAFIGYDKNKKVRVAEILPLNVCCWGVGSGSKGSYNYDPAHIQFEICEDTLDNKDYYTQAIGTAAEYCAHLCKQYGLSVEQIVSHKEAHAKGYGSNHSDPEHWMKRFGQTMDDFRKQVQEKLNHTEPKKQQTTSTEANTPFAYRKGDLVSLVKGATYYHGQAIPKWVQSQNWYVKQDQAGDRVVIDRNEDGTHSICSPVRAAHLALVRKANATNSPNQADSSCPYLVKVTSTSLNIHQGAGNDTQKTGCITDRGVYTIVEEKSVNGTSYWGKLKSGAGWILLDEVTKI